MKLIFSNDAEIDINEIYDYIKLSSFSVNIAQENLKKIIKATKNLTIFPFMGRIFDDGATNTRIFSSHRQFTILYRVHEDKVHIIRIFYKGRDY